MDNCSVCGKELKEYEGRTPDPEVHDDALDYYIPCYCEAGYGEQWLIKYVDIQYGDSSQITVDLEPKVHPFRVPSIAGITGKLRPYYWRKLCTQRTKSIKR